MGVTIGGHRILHGIDLTLHPGEMCALIGPSGAGKSTLIRALLGLRKPEDGSVKIGSTPVADVGPVGYVPQDDALHRGLTVRRELAYAAELRMPETSEGEREARLAEVLDQVGLADRADVRIRRLSGGQRKRVAVALELLTGPPLVILDEPTSGLDPGLEARTMTLLSDVAHTGRIVMVATHAMESIEMAEALCVLVGGHLAFFGPPRDALSYFRVDRYAGLFGQLGKQTPAAWHLTADVDADQRRFLGRSGPAIPATRASSDSADREGESSSAEEALERLKDRMGTQEPQ